jgi:hypothetical protein
MKISVYSTAFNIIGKGFNFEDALDNWFYYADEVSISVNKSNDETFLKIKNYAESKQYNLLIEETNFDYSDPFFYGKLENSALQRCTGDILFQQNLDERIGGNIDILKQLCANLLNQNDYFSFFVPVINLHTDYYNYIDIGQKWYIHKRGANRGPVNFGLKENGLPDYNKTSTDELIDKDGNLLPTFPLNKIKDNLDGLNYFKSGLPFTYHLGYVDLNERVKRNEFWKNFWEKATGGDSNTHSLNIQDYTSKSVSPHNLQLWNKICK